MSHFVENNDNHQLIQSHIHQWTTNPISKHHQYADGSIRIRAVWLNNRERDLGSRSPDKQVTNLKGETAWETDALFFCASKHTCPLSVQPYFTFAYTSDLPGPACILLLDKEQLHWGKWKFNMSNCGPLNNSQSYQGLKSIYIIKKGVSLKLIMYNFDAVSNIVQQLLRLSSPIVLQGQTVTYTT